ncbi:MAG: hypothetical protein HY561_12930, partial [Gemmatimonadetes bacterium]|nr:hypothetical protein [Gemmatimonadota bacterium]
MSPSAWPAAVPFDPDAGGLPSDLEALFEHPAAAVPAVLLLASPAARVERQWAGRVAVSLAAAWADRGRRVVLADLCLESPELHELVGEANLEGIADIFLFGASLRHVAKPVVGSLFFTPAGPPVPDPAEVLAHPRWERLVAGFGEAQATMLLYVAAGSAGLETLAARVGRAVVLSTPGEELAATSSLPADCKIAAVLWPPAPVEEAAPEAAAPAAVPAGVESAAAPPAEVRATPPVAAEPEPALAEPTFVQRQPKRRRRVSPVLWLGLVLALGGGGWFTAQEYFPETQGYLSRVIRQIPFLGGADSGTPASAAAAATAPQPTPPPARTPIESPIPYSVAIEAHQSLAIAQERVDALREAEPQILFYIAPLLLDSV